tara:strand:+ start:60 stop:209 length:150 start_codon:yes stop_codon:yes gene_type:complete
MEIGCEDKVILGCPSHHILDLQEKIIGSPGLGAKSQMTPFLQDKIGKQV